MGRARLRDSDGTSIVALPESELETLDLVAEWSAQRDRLMMLLLEDRPLTVVDLGPLAWLAIFDREDQLEFAEELRQALVLSMSLRESEPLRTTIREWQVTASELDDPIRREALTRPFRSEDFVDAGHDLGAMTEDES